MTMQPSVIVVQGPVSARQLNNRSLYYETLLPLRVFAWIQIIFSSITLTVGLAFFILTPIVLIILSVVLVVPLLILLILDSSDPFAPIWNNFGFPSPLTMPMLCIVWPTFFLASIFTGIILLKGVRQASRLHLHLWTMYAISSIILFVYQGTLKVLNLMANVDKPQKEKTDHLDTVIIVCCSVLTLLYFYFIVVAQASCNKIRKEKDYIPPQASYNPHYHPGQAEQFELH